MRNESNDNLTARSFPIWCVLVVVFLVAASAQAQVITLTPTSLNFGDVTVGNSSTMSFTVTNTGNSTTSAPVWYDRVYLSLDAEYQAGDTHLANAVNGSFLNPGDSYVSSANVFVIDDMFDDAATELSLVESQVEDIADLEIAARVAHAVAPHADQDEATVDDPLEEPPHAIRSLRAVFHAWR